MFTIIGRVYDSKLRSIRSTQGVAQRIKEVDFEFDCFLVNRTKNATDVEIMLLEAIASGASWVEIFGLDAEKIHDAIDEASVRIKRQRSVGDGNPMTAWHEDMMGDADIASYILTGGQGDAEQKIIVVIGSAEDERRLIDQLTTLKQ